MDRAIRLNLDSRMERVLEGATVQALDALFESEGLQLLVSGADFSEPAADDGSMYCYMPVLESPVPTINSTRIRLTCSVRQPRSGLVLLNTDEMANLIQDSATGEFMYDETWSTSGIIRADMTSTLTYRQAGANVSLVHNLRSSTRSPLPDWFPFPEDAFSNFVKAFVREAIASQQSTLLDQIQQRCAEL